MAQCHCKKKRKHRPQNRSVFIFCEGDAEENLWKYLKEWLRNNNVSIRCIIKNSKGGDCHSIVKEAAKQYKAKERETSGELSTLIIMMDTDNRFDKVISSLIQKKRNSKKPIWKFVLCSPCLEQTIAELIGKGDFLRASINKKQAIKHLINCLPHEIDWNSFLENHAKTPEDIFKLSEFKEVYELFFHNN